MPKFSIIIPVYNVEDYIKECLDSIKKQTYKDYEVIVVNDGTKDNSMDIVKKYPVTIINQENQGLSAARNTGAKQATGEYLLFVDSDDYLEKDTLKKINQALTNNPDVVRFQIKEVFDNQEEKQYPEEPFRNKSGEEAFKLLTNYHFVENAWCYAIKRKYYEKEKFSFKKGTIHEDFGLIPLVIIKAKTVTSISYIGYNYRQRQGSIMSTENYEKTKKKVGDFYNHYQYLVKEIDKTNLEKEYFKSFIANSLILKITELKTKDYKKYKKKLKQDKVFDQLIANTIPRKVKKLIIRISPRLYYKILIK